MIFSNIFGQNIPPLYLLRKKRDFVFLLLSQDSRTALLTVKDATRRASAVARWAILDIATCRLLEMQQQKNENFKFPSGRFCLF